MRPSRALQRGNRARFPPLAAGTMRVTLHFVRKTRHFPEPSRALTHRSRRVTSPLAVTGRLPLKRCMHKPGPAPPRSRRRGTGAASSAPEPRWLRPARRHPAPEPRASAAAARGPVLPASSLGTAPVARAPPRRTARAPLLAARGPGRCASQAGISGSTSAAATQLSRRAGTSRGIRYTAGGGPSVGDASFDGRPVGLLPELRGPLHVRAVASVRWISRPPPGGSRSGRR